MSAFALAWLCACGPGPAGDDDETGSTTTSSPECVIDADCSDGGQCQGGVCEYDPCLESGCDPCLESGCDPCLDTGCEEGPFPQCFGDQDCFGGEVCDDGTCQQVPELDGCDQAPTFVELPLPMAANTLPIARVAAGDFNGDGIDEIVAMLAADSSEFRVFEPGDGAVISTSAIVEPEGFGLQPLHIDDDGLLDLASDQDLWLGDGVGGFSHLGVLADSTSVDQLGRADLDGDGRDDLVRLDATQAWHNLGGSFESLPGFDPIAGRSHATVGDFFAAGDDSLGIGGSNDTVFVARWVAGSWEYTALDGELGGQFPELAMARPLADGPDLLVGVEPREAGITLLTRWRADGPTSLDAVPGYHQRLAVADLDGDGDEELVFADTDPIYVDLDGCFAAVDLLGDAGDQAPVAANLDDDPEQELLILSGGVLRVLDPQ